MLLFIRVLIATNDEFIFYIPQEILLYIFWCTKILNYQFRMKKKKEKYEIQNIKNTKYTKYLGDMVIYNKLHYHKENSHRCDDKIRIYEQKDGAN